MDRLKLWLIDKPTHTNEDLLEELRSIQTFASLRPSDRAIIYLGTEKFISFILIDLSTLPPFNLPICILLILIYSILILPSLFTPF